MWRLLSAPRNQCRHIRLQVFKRFPQGYSAQTEHHCVPATAVQQRDAAAGFSSAARPRPPTFASLKDSIEKARRRNPKGYDEAAVSQAKNQAGIEGPAARLLVEKQATTKTTDPQAVSPDLIASAALRRVALTTLPKAVQESMYDFLRDYSATAPELRTYMRHLSDKRDSLHANRKWLADQAKQVKQTEDMRTSSGRLTAKSLREAQFAQGAEPGTAPIVNDHVYNAMIGLPPPLSVPKPQSRTRSPDDPAESPFGKMLWYSEHYTLASVASTAGELYGTAYKVFREMAAADPSFKPARVLDFGAGYGAALMAAQMVWPGAIKTVVAVEPSEYMSKAGRRFQRDLQNSLSEEAALRDRPAPAEPRITWTERLPELTRVSRPQRSYDLVILAHQLDDMDAQHSHEKLAHMLWGVTDGAMVVLEKGTQQGFDAVRRIRQSVLDVEARQVAREERRAKQNKSDNQEAGAYVVAPCPHDKRCPLESRFVDGRREWCHFGQKVHLPEFSRSVLEGVRGKSGRLAQDYTTVNYSYVILKRGRRQEAATVQVTETAAAIKKPATMPLHLPGSVIRKQVMLHRAEQMGQTGVEAFASFDAADSELSDDFSEDDEPKDADEATLAESDAAKLRSMAGIRADSTASSAASKGRAPLFGAHDSEDTPSSAPEPLKSAVPGRAPEQPHGHPGSAASAAAAAFERKYPSYARGLLDSLIQLEERKVDWTSTLSKPQAGQPPEADATGATDGGSKREIKLAASSMNAPPDFSEHPMTKAEMARAVAQLLHSIYGLNQQEARQAAMQALPARDGSVTVYIGQNDKEAAEEFDAESDEEEYEHVLSSSSTWGRLYRPTVRSSESNKETISMWLCVPESERVKDGRRDGEPEGGLQRQVVHKPLGFHKAPSGKAAFKLAERIGWGDLWPPFYSVKRSKDQDEERSQRSHRE